MVRAAAVAVALALSSCTVHTTREPIPSPAPPPDPAPVGACDRACERLRELGCAAYAPDCVAACQNIEDQYAAGQSELTLNPECIGTIATCEEADTKCRD